MHQAIQVLEGVMKIEILYNYSAKRLRTHHDKRDNMGVLSHMLSTLNIKETQNYLPLQKIKWEQNSHL